MCRNANSVFAIVFRRLREYLCLRHCFPPFDRISVLCHSHNRESSHVAIQDCPPWTTGGPPWTTGGPPWTTGGPPGPREAPPWTTGGPPLDRPSSSTVSTNRSRWEEIREELIKNTEIHELPPSEAQKTIREITRLKRRNPDTEELEDSFTIRVHANETTTAASLYQKTRGDGGRTVTVAAIDANGRHAGDSAQPDCSAGVRCAGVPDLKKTDSRCSHGYRRRQC